MDVNFKFAIIIITVGRYAGVRSLLDSIENQSYRPNLVIIMDANKHCPEGSPLGKYGFPIRYINTGPNSATEARNIGIKNVPDDFQLICFLDDDTVLCDDAIANMRSFWAAASEDTGGAAFNNINAPAINNVKVKKFFVLNSSEKGVVLKSGFATLLYPAAKDERAQWLSGGNVVWRKKIFGHFKFDENLPGYGFVDDLDFSYAVGKHYKLFVVAKARIKHFPHPVHTGKVFHLGIMEVICRRYFLRKHGELSPALFYWAYLGLIATGFVSSILYLRLDHFKRACGNIAGVLHTMISGGKPVHNHSYSNIRN